MRLTLTLRWTRRGREVRLEVTMDLWKLGLLAALAYGLWRG
jgi:hypothetical protein